MPSFLDWIGVGDIWTFITIIIKMLLSIIIGAAIGIERERFFKVRNKTRAAGFRTYTLVCLGSCLFGIASMYGFQSHLQSAVGIVIDPGRMAAQVVAGVGFLGAGAIMKERGRIRGLTTAAGLWVSAALGLVISSNLVVIGVIAAILTYVMLDLPRIFPRLFAEGVDDIPEEDEFAEEKVEI